MKTKSKSKMNILSKEEIKKLKGAVETGTEKLIVYLLLYTGMRVSELIHFKKEWLYIRKGFIYIPDVQKCLCNDCKRIIKTKEGKIKKNRGEWKPKTEDGSRLISILPDIESLLTEYFNKHQSIMETIPHRIFVWRILQIISIRAGISHPVFPHAIRATFATNLAEENIDVLALKDVMGWKDINVAKDYVKFSGAKLKEEFKKIKGKW